MFAFTVARRGARALGAPRGGRVFGANLSGAPARSSPRARRSASRAQPPLLTLKSWRTHAGVSGPKSPSHSEAARAEAEAALRRADAEVAALRQRAEADAEATRTRATSEAEATRTRATSEAEATRTRAASDAQKAQAEAEATHTRATSEAEAMRQQSWLQRTQWQIRFYSLSALACALAVDWVLHEEDMFIKWRMAAQLRKCLVPAAASAAPVPHDVLPVKREPFIPDFIPTVLLAPTGAGKSTLLAAAARSFAVPADARRVPAPVVLVRIRQTPAQDTDDPARMPSTGARASSSAEPASMVAFWKAGREQLDAAAVQVYEQIGFPTRRAFLRSLVDRGISFKYKDLEYEVHEADVTRSRLVQALDTLFRVSAAVCLERVAAGLPRWDAAPVLLFDEAQDLIRDDRIARVGGIEVFRALAKLLVIHCVDSNMVRAAISGSSALLSVYLERTVASGFRVFGYNLPDPEPEPVLRALCAQGYTAHEAEEMVTLCGTRLRLLERPLKHGAATIGARAFMDEARATAAMHFTELLSGASDEDVRVLISTLDELLWCDDVGTGADDVPRLNRAFTPRLAAAAAKVLYLRDNWSLAFQSRLHANVWRRERGHLLRAGTRNAAARTWRRLARLLSRLLRRTPLASTPGAGGDATHSMQQATQALTDQAAAAAALVRP